MASKYKARTSQDIRNMCAEMVDDCGLPGALRVLVGPLTYYAQLAGSSPNDSAAQFQFKRYLQEYTRLLDDACKAERGRRTRAAGPSKTVRKQSFESLLTPADDLYARALGIRLGEADEA